MHNPNSLGIRDIKLHKSIYNGITMHALIIISGIETSASREPSKLRKLKSTKINYRKEENIESVAYIEYEIKP
jgi:hypothetical protein